jgi:hypothetical protein
MWEHVLSVLRGCLISYYAFIYEARFFAVKQASIVSFPKGNDRVTSTNASIGLKMQLQFQQPKMIGHNQKPLEPCLKTAQLLNQLNTESSLTRPFCP